MVALQQATSIQKESCHVKTAPCPTAARQGAPGLPPAFFVRGVAAACTNSFSSMSKCGSASPGGPAVQAQMVLGFLGTLFQKRLRRGVRGAKICAH